LPRDRFGWRWRCGKPQRRRRSLEFRIRWADEGRGIHETVRASWALIIMTSLGTLVPTIAQPVRADARPVRLRH
jgi:hypothetical protein